MALILRRILDSYHYYFYELKDHRSDGYFLIGNPPVSMALLLCGYVIMIKHGPKLMELRKPFELKTVLMIYNLVQIVLNLALGFYGTYNQIFEQHFNFNCQPVNYSSTPQGVLDLKLTYCYFLLKVLDLLDTVFIVLKKNNAQLSFLHCYHHFLMVLGIYCGVRWIPGGHPMILGVVNSFVHGFMYSYYFLTALKPELKKSLWWKRYITQIQLLQFAILVVHFFRGVIAKDCAFPKFWMWVLTIQNTFMMILFSDFYLKAYFKKPVSARKLKE